MCCSFFALRAKNEQPKKDFLTCIGSFFALRAKKEPTKEEKYHAAAGENRFCVSPT
jgi:hypothetical protein